MMKAMNPDERVTVQAWDYLNMGWHNHFSIATYKTWRLDNAKHKYNIVASYLNSNLGIANYPTLDQWNGFKQGRGRNIPVPYLF